MEDIDSLTEYAEGLDREFEFEEDIRYNKRAIFRDACAYIDQMIKDEERVENHMKDWDEKYRLCLEFVRQNNKLPLSPSFDSREVLLAKWIYRQRKRYIQPNKTFQGMRYCYGPDLTPYEKQMLEEIPNWSWDHMSEDARDRYMLEQLRQYVKITGMPRADAIPGSFESSLYLWCNRQRFYYHCDSLYDAEKIAALKEIPDWTWNYEGITRRFYDLTEADISALNYRQTQKYCTFMNIGGIGKFDVLQKRLLGHWKSLR